VSSTRLDGGLGRRSFRFAADHSPAFLIPQIGGVVIYHDTTTLGSKSTDSAALKRRLEAADLQLPIAYFAAQLYALLGVPPVDGRYADEHLRAHPKTLRPMDGWQKINFMRSIIGSNLQEATGTLISITRLVARIKEMVIKREVRVDVEGAVNALQKVRSKPHYSYVVVGLPGLTFLTLSQLAASTDAPTTLTDLFSAARDAAQLSNRAFFNPSMMGLLYFVSMLDSGSNSRLHCLSDYPLLSPMSTSMRSTRHCSPLLPYLFWLHCSKRLAVGDSEGNGRYRQWKEG